MLQIKIIQTISREYNVFSLIDFLNTSDTFVMCGDYNFVLDPLLDYKKP